MGILSNVGAPRRIFLVERRIIAGFGDYSLLSW
jgi:hypothetical protein